MKVEIFAANTDLCHEMIHEVKELACPLCKVIVHDVSQPAANTEAAAKAARYGIQSFPAIAINGKPADYEAVKKSGKLKASKAR